MWRDGGVHEIGFANGDVAKPLVSRPLERRDDRGVRSTGTRVALRPDPKYFDVEAIPLADLQRLLRSKAVLLPGVTVTLTDERAKGKPPTVETWRYEHGLRGYLVDALAQSSGAEPLIPLYEGRRHAATAAAPTTAASPKARARTGSSPGPTTARCCASRTST